MRWEKERLVSIGFVVLSLGSALFLTGATLNYLNYYPALGQIYTQADRVATVSGSNQSRVDVSITTVNPSDYSGMRLGGADVTLFFYAKDDVNATFRAGSLNAIQTIGGDFGPHARIPADIIVRLNSDDANNFTSFIDSHNSQVIARVFLQVEVISFLDSATGRLSFTSTDDLPLILS